MKNNLDYFNDYEIMHRLIKTYCIICLMYIRTRRERKRSAKSTNNANRPYDTYTFFFLSLLKKKDNKREHISSQSLKM